MPGTAGRNNGCRVTRSGFHRGVDGILVVVGCNVVETVDLRVVDLTVVVVVDFVVVDVVVDGVVLTVTGV